MQRQTRIRVDRVTQCAGAGRTWAKTPMPNESLPLLMRCRGSIMPLLAVSLAALIGMAGLALDLGPVYLTKTRLQNAVDAAAVGGARELDQQGSWSSDTAKAAGRNRAIDAFRATIGNSTLTPVVTMATNLDCAVAGTNVTATHVCVTYQKNYTPQLLKVVGTGMLTVSAKAVAGHGITCVAPIIYCGDSTPAVGVETKLYLGGQLANTVAINCPSGQGSCVRDLLAGTSNNSALQCSSGQLPSVAPGFNVGQVRDAVNYRFGDVTGFGASACNVAAGAKGFDANVCEEFLGANCRCFYGAPNKGVGDNCDTYDLIKNSPYTYSKYTSPGTTAQSSPTSCAVTAASGRRVIKLARIPLASCGTNVNVPITEYLCYFIRKRVVSSPQGDYISGEFIGGYCEGEGPGGSLDDQRIFLYR